MSEQLILVLPYLAPLPVGSKVELTYYEGPAGLFGKAKEIDTPSLRHIDTGVLYSTKKLHRSSLAGVRTHNRVPVTPGLTPARSIVGTISACTVIDRGHEWAPHTELVINLDREPEGFR